MKEFIEAFLLLTITGDNGGRIIDGYGGANALNIKCVQGYKKFCGKKRGGVFLLYDATNPSKTCKAMGDFIELLKPDREIWRHNNKIGDFCDHGDFTEDLHIPLAKIKKWQYTLSMLETLENLFSDRTTK